MVVRVGFGGYNCKYPLLTGEKVTVPTLFKQNIRKQGLPVLIRAALLIYIIFIKRSCNCRFTSRYLVELMLTGEFKKEIMTVKKAIFEGLVFDENENPVRVVNIGLESFYVVNDSGFMRHINSEVVDRQVLDSMLSVVKDHEDIFTDQTAKMLGQEDIFTRALIQNQLKNIDQQVDKLLETGLPEEGRAYMGMMGFKIIINYHGEVISINQPGAISEDDEGDE